MTSSSDSSRRMSTWVAVSFAPRRCLLFSIPRAPADRFVRDVDDPRAAGENARLVLNCHGDSPRRNSNKGVPF